MHTPFDDVIDAVRARHFHNHRRQDHSGTVSRGILSDLLATCEPFRRDFADGRIREWFDFPWPGGRRRKRDLVVAEPGSDPGVPDLSRLRLCVENKSVVTAHRRRTNRCDDLSEVLGVVHGTAPDAILVATVLVGVADYFLNVPDGIKKAVAPRRFERRVLPRLSSGDEALWGDLRQAVSRNHPRDPKRTVNALRELPTRPPGRTDVVGYDYVLLVPVFIDNVSPPRVERANALGIDVDGEYRTMLDRICRADTARWHT